MAVADSCASRRRRATASMSPSTAGGRPPCLPSVEMVERLPFGTRTAVEVRCVRCALCGAFGELVLEGGRLDRALARARDHVREVHPGADVPEALRLVPDVGFPLADCRDVAEWIAQYNARNTVQTRGPK
ncbi:hypothetical protein ACFYYS_18040 [Streptomyces sp. NPDC002120]|uniref:hypothetical protein n=1 Tax=Streptomyces sp. NPDC002120 TaxID=3364631 RepID=UPI0036BDDEFB